MKKSRWDKTIGKRFNININNANAAHISFCFYQKFLGCLIKRGLRQKALLKFSNILFELKKKEKIAPIFFLYSSLSTIAPQIFLKSFKKGQKLQPYPVAIKHSKRISFATR